MLENGDALIKISYGMTTKSWASTSIPRSYKRRSLSIENMRLVQMGQGLPDPDEFHLVFLSNGVDRASSGFRLLDDAPHFSKNGETRRNLDATADAGVDQA